MKEKLLAVPLVFMFTTPAIADDPTPTQYNLDLSGFDLINVSTSPISEGCSGEAFQGNYGPETPLEMTALFLHQCLPGTYLNVTENAAVGSDGVIVGTECLDCSVGHYCSGVNSSNLVMDNNILSNQGLTECPVGTYAGTTGLSDCIPCAAGTYTNLTGQSECAQAQAGYYTPNTISETQCPVGYRNGAAGTGTSLAACLKTISCPDECSIFNNFASCSINNTENGNPVTYGNRTVDGYCFETITQCSAGYTKGNLYSWMYDHMNQISENIAYCTPGGTGANCVSQESGTSTWTITGNHKPVNNVHLVSVCTSRTADPQDASSLIVNQTTAGFSRQDTGANCWMRNIDMPNQPWFFVDSYSAESGLTAAEVCAQNCGSENITDNLVQLLATATASDPDTQVCVGNTVNINWAGVSLDENDPAKTCTYGGDLITPANGAEHPTDPTNYLFLGWSVEDGD